MKKLLIILFVSFSTILLAQNKWVHKYIFAGHTYDGYSYDSRLRQINISDYDGIFLGGDNMSEASLDRNFLSSLDSLIDLSNPMTLYAMGNHDSRNGNWDWVSQFTGRKTYSAHYEDKSVFIVLNTNIVPYDCEMLEDEFDMIYQVCDTIEDAQNLFFIMHHVIWNDVPGLQPAWMTGHVNAKYWLANCDNADSHFYNTIYPLLVNVKNRGVDIFVIAGDMGSGSKKKYYEQSSDGINFMGCGLYHYSTNDEVLIFENNNGDISFGFHNLDSLTIVNKATNGQ
jgi:hypothetical protein